MDKLRVVSRLILCVVSCLLIASTSTAADFYVSPNASANGTGSFANPWRLQTALSQPAAVHPGDTIWLRGGTYSGTYQSNLIGTASQPIVVRQYTGERATIDGGDSAMNAILFVTGKYTWFWGFEIMSSDPDRQSSIPGEDPSPNIGRGNGFTIQQSAGAGVGVKFINLIIHDTRENDFWDEAIDAEVYGCLIYYNGWEASDRGHGHGLYIQNQTGTKKITDNILFSGFSHGIHAYGSGNAFLDNINVTGNTIFNSGELSWSNARNILIGGGSVAHNPVVNNNSLYYPPGGPQSALNMGYSAGCSNATIATNYFANDVSFNSCLPTSMTGNTFYGNIYGFNQSQYPNNTYYSNRPTGVKVFIRPNAFEAGRANITIYNWDMVNTVNVSLAGILGVGTAFEVRNAQDFFGAPVLTGTYAGGNITLPMSGLSVAAPVGWAAPAPTGKEFNVFVVLPVLGAPAPTATNTPSGGSTPTATKTPTTPTKTPTSNTPPPTFTKTKTPTKTNTPVPPTATKTPSKTPTPSGSQFIVRIEGEAPTVTSPMAKVNSGGAFGGQYIQTATANSGTGSWSFSVPSSGTYYVWGRVTGVDGNHDSFFVKMDSGAEDIYDVAEGTWSPNWQWTRLNGRGSAGVPLTLNPRTFSLSAGSHTLTFRGREVSTWLDRVIVTNDPGFVPTEIP